ncbi:hypothetical protein [Oceanospirillum sediminis]|uniref:Uncharacterized protein n=1 Tax=Oceanospirillum sediminis TaxID=2760088 RepID=A0A839IT34_9GAMM|nr:hypothetical protein [Oceanospirillum sediminis]MBB1487840.1 hypothetical protein [Oceanospirillum sediminis]
MNTFTKLVIASVAAVSTQVMADNNSVNNPFSAIEPASYSQEANLIGVSHISNDVVVLKAVEPAANSKEAQLTDAKGFSYDFEEVAFHDVEPASTSKEAIL